MGAAELWLPILAALIAFALAAWRFPFAQESAPVLLLLGGGIVAAYLLTGLVCYATGDPEYFANRLSFATFGLGVVAYAAIALCLGKRLRP